MSEPNGHAGVDASGLRERLPNKPEKPQKAESLETAEEAVRALNQQEAANGKEEKDKKTFGRTPDGTGEYSRCSRRRGVQRASTIAAAAISRQVEYATTEPTIALARDARLNVSTIPSIPPSQC